MFELQLSTLGWNKLAIEHKNKKNEVIRTHRVTVLSSGIVDRVALVILRFLGKVFTSLQPILVSPGSKYKAMPKMYATRGGVESLLLNEAVEHSRKEHFHLLPQERREWKNEIHKTCAGAEGYNLTSLLKHVNMMTISRQEQKLKRATESLAKAACSLKQKSSFYFDVSSSTGDITFYSADIPNSNLSILTINEKKEISISFHHSVGRYPCYIAEKLGGYLQGEIKQHNTIFETAAFLLEKLTEREYGKYVKNYVADPKQCDTYHVITIDDELNYYDANHIEVEGQKYLATHQPFPFEQDVFWKMVHENHVPLIVKLTDTTKPSKEEIEEDHVKDMTYWPRLGEVLQIDDNLSVSLKETVKFKQCLTMRTFTLKAGDSTREVKQIDFTGWPDGSVPLLTEFDQLIELVDSAKAETPNAADHPMLVHCRAGIGRTGTFIASHSTRKKEGEVDFVNIVKTVRSQRPMKMVETVDQYQFLDLVRKKNANAKQFHVNIKSAISLENATKNSVTGDTLHVNIDPATDALTFSSIASPDPTGITFSFLDDKKIQVHIDHTIPQKHHVLLHQLADGLEYRLKNSKDDIPKAVQWLVNDMLKYEFSTYVAPYFYQQVEGVKHVQVTLDDKKLEVDANFVNVNGHSYIAAREPMLLEKNQFWQMIFKTSIPITVKLTQTTKLDKDDFFDEPLDYSYWPNEGDTLKYGEVEVTQKEAKVINQNLTVRTFELKNGDQVRSVVHVDYTGWPDNGNPDMKEYLELMNVVIDLETKYPGGPLLVHCNDGHSLTGSFIASHSEWENQETNFPQTVKAIRSQRAYHMVGNDDQYAFLYAAHATK